MFKLLCKGKGIWDYDGKIFRFEMLIEDIGECVCGGLIIYLFFYVGECL